MLDTLPEDLGAFMVITVIVCLFQTAYLSATTSPVVLPAASHSVGIRPVCDADCLALVD